MCVEGMEGMAGGPVVSWRDTEDQDSVRDRTQDTVTLGSGNWGPVQCDPQHTEDLEPRSQKKSEFCPLKRPLLSRKSLVFSERAFLPLNKPFLSSKCRLFSSKKAFLSKKGTRNYGAQVRECLLSRFT